MEKLLSKVRSKRKKGFTLFEILVVVVILGVLATIAVPTYNKIIRKSRVSDGLHALDMLASAQDKYYIKNGHYAQSLGALNAPIADNRVSNPLNPFQNIETTNFMYNKDFHQHCVTATSRIGGNYTLVKNYKTNDKIVCKGADCNTVSDYVDEISESGFNLLCPNEITCDIDQNYCTNHGNLHFWPIPVCECKCTEEKYNECLEAGFSLDYNTCECAQVPCDVEGQVYSEGVTNRDCPFTGELPIYAQNNEINLVEEILQKKQKAKVKNTRTGTTPGDEPQEHICGWEYYKEVCRNHVIVIERECKYKGDWCKSQGYNNMNPFSCECYNECDPNVPHTVSAICPMNTNPYELCDPCTNSAVVVNNRDGGIPGSNMEDGCCGYRENNNHEVECNHQTGLWECINKNECKKVNSDEGKDCDGHDIYPDATEGNTCGVKKYKECRLIGMPRSGVGAEVITTCELKTGNECFEGQTRTCPTDSSLVQVCGNDCLWGGCSSPQCTVPGYTEACPTDPTKCRTCLADLTWSPCGDCECDCSGLPMPSDGSFMVPDSQCRQFKPACVRNSSTGLCEWVADPEGETEWVSGAECESGTWVECSRRPPGEGCCDEGELRQCAEFCGTCDGFTGYIENINLNVTIGCNPMHCNNCLSWCGGELHQICYNGSGGGGGGHGGYFPPVPPGGWNGGYGGGDDPEEITTKYCNDCKWTDCTEYKLCDPEDMMSGHGARVVSQSNENICRVETTEKQVCKIFDIEGMLLSDWEWDFSGETTVTDYQKPTNYPDDIYSSKGCFSKHKKWVCGSGGWVSEPYGSWIPNPAKAVTLSCGMMTNHPGDYTVLPDCEDYFVSPKSGYFCNSQCLNSKCPSGYDLTSDKKCVKKHSMEEGTLFYNDSNYIVNGLFSDDCKTRSSSDYLIACLGTGGNIKDHFSEPSCDALFDTGIGGAYTHFQCKNGQTYPVDIVSAAAVRQADICRYHVGRAVLSSGATTSYPQDFSYTQYSNTIYDDNSKYCYSGGLSWVGKTWCYPFMFTRQYYKPVICEEGNSYMYNYCN